MIIRKAAGPAYQSRFNPSTPVGFSGSSGALGGFILGPFLAVFGPHGPCRLFRIGMYKGSLRSLDNIPKNEYITQRYG
jgi:hypothetical protein